VRRYIRIEPCLEAPAPAYGVAAGGAEGGEGGDDAGERSAAVRWDGGLRRGMLEGWADEA
jgi:hypothetical protein